MDNMEFVFNSIALALSTEKVGILAQAYFEAFPFPYCQL